MKRQDLEAIWEEVHPDLPHDGPLHSAIIQEGIDSGGQDPGAIADGLDNLATDIQDFARGTRAKAQGLTVLRSPRAL